MMKRIRLFMLAVFFSTALAPAVSSCGSGHDDMGGTASDSWSMLAPRIKALDTRLQSHYTTVAWVLNAGNAGTQGLRPLAAAAAQGSGSMNEDWQAIRTETEDYTHDMQRILENLGHTVTAFGACRMMMGGVMYGSPDSGNTCPSEPHMERSREEVEQHLGETLDWVDLEDPSGLRQEMDRHRYLMGSHILDMGSHMRHTYGSPGGMGGMM